MALLCGKTFPALAGVSVGYWRLTRFEWSEVGKCLSFFIGGWVNQAAYDGQPIGEKQPLVEVQFSKINADFDAFRLANADAVSAIDTALANVVRSTEGWTEATDAS